MRILGQEEDKKLTTAVCPGCGMEWLKYPDAVKLLSVNEEGAVVKCRCGRTYLRAPLVLLSEFIPALRPEVTKLGYGSRYVTMGAELEDSDFNGEGGEVCTSKS